MQYTEFRHYSIKHDKDMVRISMADSHGGEFFMLIDAETSARRYRERRTEALSAIEYAIEMGMQPGMVRVSASS